MGTWAAKGCREWRFDPVWLSWGVYLGLTGLCIAMAFSFHLGRIWMVSRIKGLGNDNRSTEWTDILDGVDRTGYYLGTLSRNTL